MQPLPRHIGWIEVICGPMFSGKTEEMIRRLRRVLYARQAVQIFKPHRDTRYDPLCIASHGGQMLEAEPVRDAWDIEPKIRPATEVVAIDEVQFFNRHVVEMAQAWASGCKRVIIAGLDQDFQGKPFEPMPELLAVAECITKTLAICVVCGNPAGRTQRLGPERQRVMLGTTHSYEARCRRCHHPPAVAASVAAPSTDPSGA